MASEYIKQVYAMINGQRVVASYDEASDLYTISTTAPADSSWPQEDHKYGVELFAEDLAGNVTKVDRKDETYGDQLAIRVLEPTLPTVTIEYPTESSVLGKSSLTAKATVTAQGKSGVTPAQIEFKCNSDVISNINWEGDGTTYHADVKITGLSDGSNSITVKATDNDGNENSAKVSFLISTEAPSLDITQPVDGIYTTDTTIEIEGNAGTGQYADVKQVTVNGVPAEVDENGDFHATVEGLVEGDNEIVIEVEDNAGNKTTVRRHVNVDLTHPVITDVKAESLVVNAGEMIKITFKVSDAG